MHPLPATNIPKDSSCENDTNNIRKHIHTNMNSFSSSLGSSNSFQHDDTDNDSNITDASGFVHDDGNDQHDNDCSSFASSINSAGPGSYVPDDVSSTGRGGGGDNHNEGSYHHDESNVYYNEAEEFEKMRTLESINRLENHVPRIVLEQLMADIQQRKEDAKAALSAPSPLGNITLEVPMNIGGGVNDSLHASSNSIGDVAYNSGQSVKSAGSGHSLQRIGARSNGPMNELLNTLTSLDELLEEEFSSDEDTSSGDDEDESEGDSDDDDSDEDSDDDDDDDDTSSEEGENLLDTSGLTFEVDPGELHEDHSGDGGMSDLGESDSDSAPESDDDDDDDDDDEDDHQSGGALSAPMAFGCPPRGATSSIGGGSSQMAMSMPADPLTALGPSIHRRNTPARSHSNIEPGMRVAPVPRKKPPMRSKSFGSEGGRNSINSQDMNSIGSGDSAQRMGAPSNDKMAVGKLRQGRLNNRRMESDANAADDTKSMGMSVDQTTLSASSKSSDHYMSLVSQVKSSKHDSTILFIDISGFTKLSRSLEVEALSEVCAFSLFNLRCFIVRLLYFVLVETIGFTHFMLVRAYLPASPILGDILCKLCRLSTPISK